MFTACNGGMYGTNCSVTCGNCFESQQCHHINGTCMDGCDDRYQGLKCIEGKDIKVRNGVSVCTCASKRMVCLC